MIPAWLHLIYYNWFMVEDIEKVRLNSYLMANTYDGLSDIDMEIHETILEFINAYKKQS
jgi:hypothetical protein